jgi:hypothetical protein
MSNGPILWRIVYIVLPYSAAGPISVPKIVLQMLNILIWSYLNHSNIMDQTWRRKMIYLSKEFWTSYVQNDTSFHVQKETAFTKGCLSGFLKKTLGGGKKNTWFRAKT